MKEIEALVATAKICKPRGRVSFIYARDCYAANGGRGFLEDIRKVNKRWPGKIKIHRRFNLSESPDIEFC